ncbi:MAG: hypothetical protein LBG65_07440, partial [Puniceicoccales bacterium]|nr:hypothetical protein [Puniceicoccales bacterium]
DGGDTAGNGKLGVLQAAIHHADRKLQANINSGMYQDEIDIKNLKLSKRFGRRNGGSKFPAPEVTERHPDGAIAVASGALGTLLQGDILQAIGSKISARSDTFVVRAYGDVGGGAGTRPTSRAYVEAIVQRTPEYVDDSKISGNAPHDPRPHSKVGEGFKAKLSAVNTHLGRRFRVVSLRWMSENEI